MTTLDQLYDEYRRSISVQTAVIARYRKSLNLAAKASDMDEVRRLNGLLYVLYQEKSELEESAAALNSYCRALCKNNQKSMKKD